MRDGRQGLTHGLRQARPKGDCHTKGMEVRDWENTKQGPHSNGIFKFLGFFSVSFHHANFNDLCTGLVNEHGPHLNAIFKYLGFCQVFFTHLAAIFSQANFSDL